MPKAQSKQADDRQHVQFRPGELFAHAVRNWVMPKWGLDWNEAFRILAIFGVAGIDARHHDALLELLEVHQEAMPTDRRLTGPDAMYRICDLAKGAILEEQARLGHELTPQETAALFARKIAAMRLANTERKRMFAEIETAGTNLPKPTKRKPARQPA